MRLASLLTACWCAVGCEVSLSKWSERHEEECVRAGTERACFCDDGARGTAMCMAAGESGPCDCIGPAPGGGVAAVALGGLHACVRLKDSTVRCWGANRDGQLGDETTVTRSEPTEVQMLTDVAQLALGGGDRSGHSCALDGGGEVHCWGLNDRGQLGDATRESRLQPVELALTDVRTLAAGTAHTCAANERGRVYCWGLATSGQLGAELPDGFTSKPVGNDEGIAVPSPVDGLGDVVALSLGREHSCALDEAGAVYCWGGTNAQLTGRATEPRAVPNRIDDLPEATAIASGLRHDCALIRTGSVWCWGDNGYGQLGRANETAEVGGFAPGPIDDIGDAIAVASGWYHACVITKDGHVWCWGRNHQGQLGDGTKEDRATPVEVVGVEDAVQLSLAVHSTCARLGNGQVWCWGDNVRGQLGDGSVEDSRVPVPLRWLTSFHADDDAGTQSATR